MSDPATVEIEPVEKAPDRKKQRIPVWLRWVVGASLVFTLGAYCVLPPQQPVSLSGWVPGCLELEAEPWREIVFDKSSLGGLSRTELWKIGPDWTHSRGELLATVALRKADKAALGAICRVPMHGQPLIYEETEYWSQWATGYHAAVAWDSATGVWIPWESYEKTQPHRLMLRLLDRDTLEVLKSIPVPLQLPLGRQWGYPSELGRAGIADDGRWWLACSLASESTATGHWRHEVYGWLFDPVTGAISAQIQLSMPTQAPNGTQVAPEEVGLLMDTGYIGEDAYEPEWLIRMTSLSEITGQWTYEFAPSPPATAFVVPPTNFPVRFGWEADSTVLELQGVETVRVAVAYEKFPLDEKMNALIPPQARQALPLLGYGTRPLYEAGRRAQSELDFSHQQQACKVRQITIGTSWAGSLTVPPELEQSIEASLDHANWLHETWTQDIAVLHGWVADDDTFLLGQLVVKTHSEDPLVERGVLRLGALTPPATQIQWIGYVPLPEGFVHFRHSYRLRCFAGEEGWLFGLSALDDRNKQTRVGGWWTSVPYPAGWTARQRGWLAADANYAGLRFDDSPRLD